MNFNFAKLSQEELAELGRLLDQSPTLDRKRAEVMGDYIEDLFTWMRLSEPGEDSFWDVNRFDNAHPRLPEESNDEFGFHTRSLDRLTELVERVGVEESPLFADITPKAVWPVNHAHVQVGLDDDTGVYIFTSMKSLSKQSARKWISQGAAGSHTMLLAEERIWKTGERRSGAGMINWSPLTGFVQSQKMKPVGDRQTVRRLAARVLSNELYYRYQWFVDIRQDEKRTGLRLETDAYGVENILKERDRPVDRSRRPALRHWVKEHWREVRRDPKTEKKIREHLRGIETFMWCGYVCRLRPSQYDLERATFAKELPAERRVVSS